jgi:DNA-directed RNA polymerase specialized sigma24 family protein
MRAALGELSVEEKRAIELGYFAAPTSEEIARRTDAFVDTVKGD